MSFEDAVRSLVARTAAISPDEVGVHIDYTGKAVIVSWPSSLLLTTDQQTSLLEHATRLLPATLRSFKIRVA